jgi:hypothetical protein
MVAPATQNQQVKTLPGKAKRVRISGVRASAGLARLRLSYRSHVGKGLWLAVNDATCRIASGQLSVEELCDLGHLLCECADSLRETCGEPKVKPEVRGKLWDLPNPNRQSVLDHPPAGSVLED